MEETQNCCYTLPRPPFVHPQHSDDAALTTAAVAPHTSSTAVMPLGGNVSHNHGTSMDRLLEGYASVLLNENKTKGCSSTLFSPTEAETVFDAMSAAQLRYYCRRVHAMMMMHKAREGQKSNSSSNSDGSDAAKILTKKATPPRAAHTKSNGHSTVVKPQAEGSSSSPASKSRGRSPSRSSIQMCERAATVKNWDGSVFLNDYMILQDVGKGATATVMLAYSTSLRKSVAIKAITRPSERRYRLLKTASIMSEGELGQMRDNLSGAPSCPTAATQPLTEAQRKDRALQAEISIMKALHHPNIVSLYEVINDPQLPKIYLVMEYVDKGSIARINNRDGSLDKRLNPEALLQVAVQVCDGLVYLHQHGVVHRDIKPENILISSSGQAYLADFGVAEVYTEADIQAKGLTVATCAFQGTPLFMPPELFAGLSIGETAKGDDGNDNNNNNSSTNKKEASMSQSTNVIDPYALDVWALGITFLSLLTGKVPFESFSAIRATTVKGHVTLPSSVPPEWQDVLTLMLQSDPSKRASAQRVLTAVEAMAAAPRGNNNTNNNYEEANSAHVKSLTSVYTLHKNVEDTAINIIPENKKKQCSPPAPSLHIISAGSMNADDMVVMGSVMRIPSRCDGGGGGGGEEAMLLPALPHPSQHPPVEEYGSLTSLPVFLPNPPPSAARDDRTRSNGVAVKKASPHEPELGSWSSAQLPPPPRRLSRNSRHSAGPTPGDSSSSARSEKGSTFRTAVMKKMSFIAD